ncbi:MAG TPA: TerB N-terminal domain-containing protein, partial [Bradyrhizobium sp.]|nr:TerB N-terminal domain-containing protein [Bradyrhizobium sp.]
KPASKFYEQSPPREKTDFELPLSVRLAIGQLASEGKPVPVEWMLSWLITDPNTYLRTPATRARTEFEELFRLRFAEKFPGGFRLNPPKRRFKHAYRAASASFTVDLDEYLAALPDISALTKPIEQMREIADACMDALDSYSRFLGKQPDARGKFSAIRLLPAELARRLESDEVRRLRQEVTASLADGPKLIELKELLVRINGVPPAQVGRAALQACADSLAYFGIGIVPDPSTGLHLPKADQRVVLYKLPEENADTTDDAAYRHALLFLGFAAYVAHADGKVSPAEREWLSTLVTTAPRLSAAARTRLDANLWWLLAVPPELAPLRVRLAALTQPERHELAAAALSVACAGGGIDPSEIKALQRIYKAIGLDDDKVLGDIHAFMSAATPATEPVTVHIGNRETQGYAIPKPPRPEEGVQLDPLRIQQISESTARVSEILAKVFVTDEAAAAAGAPPAEAPASEQDESELQDMFDGLDPPYRSFVSELLTRETWPGEDIDRLARSFGLMRDGAIEAVNEWAFDRHGDALLQDGEPLTVNTELLAAAAGVITNHA